MTSSQKLAIRCAFADLIGAYQAMKQSDIHVHDWKSHKLSIEELYEAFKDELEDPSELIGD